MSHPFRTLSKKTRPFDVSFSVGRLKLLLRVQRNTVRINFLERNYQCCFWTLIETKSTLWKKFSTGSSKLDWTSPEIHSAGTMFQKKFLQSISGFERIICGVLTKLFWQIFYRCIYTSRRTTLGLLICGKKSFFIFFWHCPKQNQPYGIYFFAIVVKTAFNWIIGVFRGEVFVKKKPFSSISDNERNNFGLLEKHYQQVVITAQYVSRETFSVKSFSWDFELLTISRYWAKNVPPCGRKIFAELSKLQ